MDVRNCIKCGRLFNYLTGQRICPSCKDALEDKFKDVKKYIEDNPHASIQMVSKEMEIEIRQLHQWIREERLLFSEDSMVTLDCEGCGCAIRTGRYCEECKNKLTKGFGNLYKTEKAPVEKTKQQRDNNRMRFLG